MPTRYVEALSNLNVRAGLEVVAEGETDHTDEAYRWLFGSKPKAPKLFDSFAAHPRIRAEYVDRAGKRIITTAAGKYQINAPTYDDFAPRIGVTDFSPASQDLIAVAIIDHEGALGDLINGRLAAFCEKCANRWASLPGLDENQPEITFERALAVFRQYGGTLAEDFPTTAAPAPQQEPTMAAPLVAFAVPLLQALVSSLPSLAPLFGSSEVAKRNQAAAMVVGDAIVKAAGAANLEEAATRIVQDPNVRDSVAREIEPLVMQLTESGGGGIAGARTYNAAPDSLPFYKQGAFAVTIGFFIVVLMLLVDVFYVHPSTYADNLRTQVVTTILALTAVISAYWLGSSNSSQRKDAALLNPQR